VKDSSEVPNRYLRDEWPRQLGNLLSTLARLSSHAADQPTTSMWLTYGAKAPLLIEWSAPR